MWEKLSVKLLREIASKYKELHSLGNISKQKKSVLLETLKKVMEFRGNVLFTKAEHGNKKVAEVEEDDEPKAKKPTPKAKEPTPKAKEPTPKAKEPTPKAKEPTPKAKEPTPKAKEPTPKAKEPTPKATEPTEQMKKRGERSNENRIRNIENSYKTKLRQRITQISNEMGVKLPRGVLTKYMYPEKMRQPTTFNGFPIPFSGPQNMGREDKRPDQMLSIALSYMGDRKTEFLKKLFRLIFGKD
jgi:outer membrane biosynthesis protein TonB